MPVTRSLGVFAGLGLAFVTYSVVVGLGVTGGADLAVAHLVAGSWRDGLRPVALGIAFLGGIELTVVLLAGLAIYIRRRGFQNEVWAVLALPLTMVAELAYRQLVHHPGPAGFSHGDAPSLTMLLGAPPAANSYPSGHVLRAVLVYGLFAFVIYRLAPPGVWRRLAVPVAAVIIAVVAIDRLYLGVHWESDVVGGILLGGLALAGVIAWLDLPRKVA